MRGAWIAFANPAGEQRILARLAENVRRLGENQHHALAPFCKRLFNGHGVGQRAVVIERAADFKRAVDARQSGGSHEHAIIILPDIVLGEVMRLSRNRFFRDNEELRGIFAHGRVIQGIFPVGIAQRAIAVLQVDIIVQAHKVAHTHVFLAKRILRVVAEIPALLPSEEGGDVRASGGYADATIESDVPLQAEIQHACSINAPHAAANVHKSRFHDGPLRA